MSRKTEKRMPIRRRVLMLVFLILIITLLAASVTGIICIRWIKNSSESALTRQLESNLKSIAEQKAVFADARLEHYEKYIEFVTDYIEGMYRNEEEMIRRGKIFNKPLDTKEYALTRAFARADMTAEDFRDDLLFFSNLEEIWDPIARENENLISTVYAGTKSGLLSSYDRWSYLSVPPEGSELVYDYYESSWYKRGLTEDGVFFTDLYIDSQGRGLTITVASPFRNADGEVMGVDCADFDITGLFDELLSIDLEEGAFSFALDREGEIISPDATGQSAEEYTGLKKDVIASLRSDADGIIETENSVLVSLPIDRIGWTLCVSVPTDVIRMRIEETDRSILYASFTFIGVVFIIVIFAILAVNKVASNITHPMELLSRDMKMISDGDLDHRATVYRNDEIGDITIQLNEMVARLKNTMKELLSSQQYANAMSELATRDSLTGIRNKTAFAAHIQELQNRIDKKEEVRIAIGVFDCDNLKGINDQYGHDKGDEYLKAASRLICSVFKHSAVFRVGGDEFTAVLGSEDFLNRASLADEFYRESDRINSAAEHEWDEAHVAIGIAVYDPRIDKAVSDTVRRADKIMYDNKRSGRDADETNPRHSYFMESDDLYWKEQYILDKFKTALDEHWIKVYYQPIMRIRSKKMAVLEALSRWMDPVRGMIEPGEFVYVLSRYHRLHMLDLYMVEEVCREFGIRAEAGLPLIPVSVNISAQDFDYVDVPGELKRLVEKYGLTSEDIIIEITEQDIAEGTDRFKEALEQLRAYGFRLWIDDFGSGYSSLNVLSQYHVDRIKFDMDLVRHLDDNNGANRRILEAMTKVCRDLGIRTLAEGVETEAQLHFLEETECDMAQGFYFFKPDPLDVSIYKFQRRSMDIPYETREELRKNCPLA